MTDLRPTVAQAALPRLALAIEHHTPALADALVRRPLPVTFRRSYSRRDGTVTLVLAGASGSAKELRYATKFTLDLLIHQGFMVRFRRSGVLQVTGYYGMAIPGVSAEAARPAPVEARPGLAKAFLSSGESKGRGRCA